jgi:hypothetical protein
MPREGSRTLSDLSSPVLRIACDAEASQSRVKAGGVYNQRAPLRSYHV